MSTDYAEKERSFIASLKTDTGKDLTGWLSAIADSGLNDRNDIIDLLRMQGFTFAKASWLERIHNNGGRLIYAPDGPPLTATASNPPHRTTRERKAAQPAASPGHAAKAPSPAPAPSSPRASAAHVSAPDVVALLAGAKGLRPLAEHILREIGALVPGVLLYADGPLVMIGTPQPIAALLPGARMIKLYAAFGVGGARTEPADLVNKALAPFPTMVQIDDARLVDDAFRALIADLLPPEPLQLRA